MPTEFKVDDDVHAAARAAMEEISKASPEPAATEAKAEEPSADAVSNAEPVAAEPTGEKDTGRARDEKGRFAKKEGEAEATAQPKEPAPDAAKQPDKAPVASAPEAKGPEGTAQVVPPSPGFSVKTKADWDKISKEYPHLVADIAKREQEINQGFAKLQSYRGLDSYVEMAQRSGTTLPEALQRYTGLEALLTRDPMQGLVQVAQNLGWTREAAAQHFAQIAQGLGYTGFAAPAHQTGQGAAQPGQTPANQNGVTVPPELHAALAPVLTPLLQQVNELKSTLSRRDQADQDRLAQTAAQIGAAFRADPANKYFANVEADIRHLFETGAVRLTGDHKADLQKAYDVACWNNPEVREALINERATKATEDRAAREREIAAKAAKASRSVSGSPAPGTVAHTPRKPGEADDPYADARAALEEIRARA